jgi:sec-independent protein translocase protein TatA
MIGTLGMTQMVLIFERPGGMEIVLILAVVLLLFGGKKIPELMKGVGKGIKSFKDGMKEEDTDSKPDSKTEK